MNPSVCGCMHSDEKQPEVNRRKSDSSLTCSRLDLQLIIYLFLHDDEGKKVRRIIIMFLYEIY